MGMRRPCIEEKTDYVHVAIYCLMENSSIHVPSMLGRSATNGTTLPALG